MHGGNWIAKVTCAWSHAKPVVQSQLGHFAMRYFLLFSIGLVCLTGCQTINDTKGQSDICEVHHIRMTKRIVPIEYGCLPPWPNLAEIKRAQENYPNPGDYLQIWGMSDPSKTRAIVYVCPKCEEAMKAMEGKHP